MTREQPQQATSDASTGHSGNAAPTETLEVLEARAKAAVLAFRKAKAGAARRPDGTLAPGHALTVKTGLHSERLLDHPDLAAWHAEQTGRIVTDLGGAEAMSALQLGMAREMARVEIVLASLGDELLAGGVLTAKGKQRAATVVYLKVLDRYLGGCKTLGLKRQARRANALLDAARASSGGLE